MTYWFYDVVRFLLRLIFGLGYGLQVTGLEHVPPRGPFILAANHVSYLDPPVLGAACSRRLVFMARATLFEQWLLGAFMRGVHVIPLQRGEGDLSAIREAVRRLHRGEAVAIFPEGGRQPTGQLGTAKRGVGLLAAMARSPVIPVLIQGTFAALPVGAKRLRLSKIRVAFGRTIPYTMGPAPAQDPLDGLRAAPGESGLPSRDHHERLARLVTAQWRCLEEQLHEHK